MNIKGILKHNTFSTSKTLIASAVCCGLYFATPMMNAMANIETVSSSNITYLQNAYFLKDLESDLNRYKAAMLIMAETRNRDDFLVNRDELWSSREELSFAISSLQEYVNSPYLQEGKEIAIKSQELLLNCESYANNQNMLIASYGKIKNATIEINRLFLDLRTSEQQVTQRQLTEAELEIYSRMINARTIFETMLNSYFTATNINEITEIVQQLQKSLSDYNDIMATAIISFPEISSSYNMAHDFFKNLFNDKGMGNEYYKFIQSSEQQKATFDYFIKTYNDLNKQIRKIQVKLSLKLNF